MNVLVLYASPNPKGSSSVIVGELRQLLTFAVEVLNLAAPPEPFCLPPFDLMLFVIATYGDQELLDTVEQFLTRPELEVAGKLYSVCELGNYYGYDDFEFGARSIAEYELIRKQAREFCPGASVDSLPRIDWEAVKAWCRALNERMTGHE